MAYNITSIPWSPPRNITWDVTTDCGLFGDFAHSIMRTSPDMDYCVINNKALHNLIFQILAANHLGEFRNGTLQQIASWYLSGCSSIASSGICDIQHCSSAVEFRNAISTEFNKSANMVCIGALRSSLGIQGNADIAGVGVMVTFGLEASLVGGFLIAQAAGYAKKWSRRTSVVLERLSIYEILTDAFKAVLPNFFWSSALQSLGIVTASVLTAAAAAGNGQKHQLVQWRAGEDFTVYDSQLSALASLFSIQVTLLASLMLQEPTKWRRILALAILPVLWTLLVGLISLTVWYIAQLPTEVHDLLQDTLRSDRLVRVFLQVSISVTTFMMAVCGMTAFVFMHWDKTPLGQGKHLSTPESGKDDALPDLETGKNKPSLKKTDDEENQSSIRTAGEGERSLPPKNDVGGSSSTGETGKEELQSARLLAAEIGVVQTILMGMMLATLGIFFHFRKQTINSDVAGDPQLEWSFGQIVVLTTWVPVIIDIWWTLLVGIKENFRMHRPEGFKAFMKENLKTMKIRVAELIVLEALKRQVRGLRKPNEAKRQTIEMREIEDHVSSVGPCDVIKLDGGNVEKRSEQDV